jgi:maltose alpha-D-glucosyltransferase/alpha-amylase
MPDASKSEKPYAPRPLWYKDAIIYQLHVRAFFDSNGDGIGDFKGLIQKLDYIQDLGVTAIWLLPFYPSPLKDDGYDIADYTSIHPSYGTLEDFRTFLDEAHRRGLNVITEAVVNHTSDQHPWFREARSSQDNPRRHWYVWSDSDDRYRGVRIIFVDTEISNWTWDPVSKSYYWHRFFSHQPDLNFDNPEVREAMVGAIKFWMDMGVDGMRLDAVPYLIEREGTSCENLPETHEVLKFLRRRLDEQFQHRMLLAEANQWPSDVRPYFGDGDECHMAFHFPLMPRIFMAIRLEDRKPIVEILQQSPEIPETCQWAIFLRNHDELTLEMVTDEERDYMYDEYAKDRTVRLNVGIRRRLAPLLDNDRRKMELMNGLLMSLPGTPVVYYGDEIGMGDNIYLGDRNGVRTPMQWSGGWTGGFSLADPERLYSPVVSNVTYCPQAVNVQSASRSPHSLLSWMKLLIRVRKSARVFSRGSIEFLHPANHRVLAYIRRLGNEIILVVNNLSSSAQAVELDLRNFKGAIPVEMAGGNIFPRIGELPYLLTLGAYQFFWFKLRRI